MIRALLAVYGLALLAYPLWVLLSPENYRGDLDQFTQAAAASTQQLQLVAALHFLKNAYLAFAFLLLARYLGEPGKSADVRHAGQLLLGFPIILLVFQVLAQIALSPDPEELDLTLSLQSDMLLYSMFGLALIGISRSLVESNEGDAAR